MKKQKTKHSKRTKKRGAKKTSPRATTQAHPALPEQRPRIGLEAILERVVELKHTIQVLDPNLPAVFSTPMMIALMEQASVAAVKPELPPGAISVGTRIEVDHLKAVGIGATVRGHARFVKYKGRFLVFDVEATSGEHVIGRGRVFRAIVQPGEHGAKAKARFQE